MMLMTELHWLWTWHKLLGGIARAIQGSDEPQYACQNKNCSQDTDASNGIGTGMKDLRHVKRSRILTGRL
jgi:hypothetical protein